MDTDSLPHRGRAWRTAKGCLGIWLPSPNLLVAALRGHADAELAHPLVDAYDQLLQEERACLFIDLQGLNSYGSRLAALLAARLLPERQRLSIDVLVEAHRPSLGFGIIGVVLGGACGTVTSRDEFRNRLDRQLTEQRVLGFSLDAVDALSNE